MNKQELAAMVAEILSGMEHEPPVKGGDYHPTAPQPEKAPTPYRDGDFVEQKALRGITPFGTRITAMLNAMADGLVTPVGMTDVVTDMLNT